MRTFIATLFLALALCGAGYAQDNARALVAGGLDAMGGEQTLRTLASMRLDIMYHRQMMEQSERPEGPYFIDYEQVSQLRDMAHRKARYTFSGRGYSADAWWLHQKAYADSMALRYEDGYAAVEQGAKLAPAGLPSVQDIEEDLALGPERLLLTAAAASDLRTLPDETLHGYVHHVVAFTWNSAAVKVYLNGNTNLPAQVDYTAARPADAFWYVWGDFTTRTVFGAWTLEPNGMHYPREWTMSRDGRLAETWNVTNIELGPAALPETFAIDAATRDAFDRTRRRLLDQAALGGRVPKPANEALPGIVIYPGPWNVALIRTDEGIIVLEAPLSSGYSQRVLEEAARRFAGVPIKAVITTSDSWPHIAGIREYAAKNIPIYALDLNLPILKRALAAHHRSYPDNFERAPLAAHFVPVRARTALGHGVNRMEIFPYRTQTGERQMMVYFPQHKLLYTSDLFAPAAETTYFTPQYVDEARTAVAREHLEVQSAWGMHYEPRPWAAIVATLEHFLHPEKT